MLPPLLTRQSGLNKSLGPISCKLDWIWMETTTIGYLIHVPVLNSCCLVLSIFRVENFGFFVMNVARNLLNGEQALERKSPSGVQGHV